MNKKKIAQAILDIVDRARDITRAELKSEVTSLSGQLVTAEIKTIATDISVEIIRRTRDGGEQLDQDEIYDLVEAELCRQNASLVGLVPHEIWD